MFFFQVYTIVCILQHRIINALGAFLKAVKQYILCKIRHKLFVIANIKTLDNVDKNK